MVPAEFRDLAGKYDGQWLAETLETRSPQSIQGWKIKCTPLELVIPMVIKEGVVTTNINDAAYSGFISSNGRFRLEIPTQMRMSNSITSEKSLNNTSITLILQGDLSRSPPSGGFILGVADLGDRGCTTSVRYTENGENAESNPSS